MHLLHFRQAVSYPFYEPRFKKTKISPVDALLRVEDSVGEDGATGLHWGAPGEAHKAAGHKHRGHIPREGGENA